jgi:hypothetical protein
MISSRLSTGGLVIRWVARLIALTIVTACAHPVGAQEITASPAESSSRFSLPRIVRITNTLRGEDGRALSGAYEVKVSLFESESGGSAVWSEQHLVNVDDRGQYFLLLGSQSPDGLPLGVFQDGRARWLEIEVLGFPPQSRLMLVSVPYALKAGDADTLGGRPLRDFMLVQETSSSGGAERLQSAAASEVETSGTVSSVSNTANRVAKFVGVDTLGDSLIFDNGTNVGIGTTSPQQKLDVNGNITLSNAPGGAGLAGFNISGDGVFRAGINMPTLLGESLPARQGAFFTMDTRAAESVLAIFTKSAGSSTEIERLTIKSTGNVGIGNPFPSQKLDVNGNVTLSNAPGGAGLAGFNISGDGVFRAGINMPTLLGESLPSRQGAFFTMDTRAGESVLAIFTKSPGSSTETERFTVKSTGNVGINSPFPTSRLEVADSSTTQTARFTQSGAGTQSFSVATPPPTAVRGDATSATGVTSGVLGITSAVLGRGVLGESLATTGQNMGVYGVAVNSPDGSGVWGEATNAAGDAVGVFGRSSSNSGTGVFGDATAASGDAVGVAGRSAAAGGTGVMGEVIANTGENYGVAGRVFNSTNSASTAGMFINTGSGNILVGRTSAAGGAANVFRVATNGQVFGSAFNTSGADFAESVAVKEDKADYVPGDVIGIDPAGMRRFTKIARAYSTLIAGIYSTKPGILASQHHPEDSRITEQEIPLAVVGIVPCKVTNENGEIRPGDLLVSSSRPGYAMKGTDRARMNGAVLGKALQPMDQTTGIIEVLVSLQ